MIGEKEFKQMKKDAILIITSRGGIVDENALLVALENNQIGGAGLDVFEWKQPPSKTAVIAQFNMHPSHFSLYPRDIEENGGDRY
jgi:phosphoglycerate dehydrogenase-like enzyme